MPGIVTFPTTKPRKSDTRWIAKQKWLQALNSGVLDGGLSQTLVFEDTEVRHHDTKLITLQKILQAQSGTGGGGGGEEEPAPAELAIVQMETFASTVDDPVDYQFGFNNPCTLGNLLVLCVVSDFTVPTPSGWTLIEAAVDATGTYIFYKISDGTEQNFTIAPGLPAPGCCVAFEISGCSAAPLDKSESATGQGPDTISTGTTAVTSQADEILIAVVGISLSGAEDASATSWSDSFVQQAQVVSTSGSPANVRLAVATKIVSAADAYTTVATLSEEDESASGAIATFKKL